MTFARLTLICLLAITSVGVMACAPPNPNEGVGYD